MARDEGRRVDQLDRAFGRQVGREPHHRIFEDGVGLALGARQSLAHEHDPFAKIERHVATSCDLFGKAFAPSGEAVGPCGHHELVEGVLCQGKLAPEAIVVEQRERRLDELAALLSPLDDRANASFSVAEDIGRDDTA